MPLKPRSFKFDEQMDALLKDIIASTHMTATEVIRQALIAYAGIPLQRHSIESAIEKRSPETLFAAQNGHPVRPAWDTAPTIFEQEQKLRTVPTPGAATPKGTIRSR